MGNAGFTAARLLSELGANIIAVSDSRGAIYNPQGLSIFEVMEYKKLHGTVADYPKAETLQDPQNLLTVGCDILIPAALENQITEDNADQIKADIVLELANGPTTPEADKILFSK